VPRVVEEFMPLRLLLPVFLELLEPGDADFYIKMTQDRDWHQHLDDATPTLLHGDLRRANISFMEGKVILFDWEFAARGPAACDLQWSAFLNLMLWIASGPWYY
jgi:Ser/Thr protein kinase RdoA (MazF antagonist)